MYLKVISALILFISLEALSAKTFKADSDFNPAVQDPLFTQIHPVVLIDQGHLNLAANDGRYAPITHLLETDGFKTLITTEKITPELLAKGQILYISGAQSSEESKVNGSVPSAFTEQEELIIQQWVKKGGALLLMADHDPIGDSIHRLAKRFNIQVSRGETNDPKNFLPNLQDQSHLLFSQDNHLIKNHPITNGRNNSESLNKVVAFSGQSLLGPKNSKIFLALSSIAENHFRDGTVKPVGSGYAEGLTLRYGKGRIVMFGDGTVFTSKIHIEKNQEEGMNRKDIDNVKLAINTFRWLAGSLDPEFK